MKFRSSSLFRESPHSSDAALNHPVNHSAPRAVCYACRRAASTCLCSRIRPIDSEAIFVILIHPRESRNPVGTGRLAKLCIKDSLLIEGLGPEFDQDPKIQSLLQSEEIAPFLLYPGPNAIRFLPGASARNRALLPSGKRPAYFVVDGTWAMAKGMIRKSALLKSLPQVAFIGDAQSNYRIRRQPHIDCLSTIEAIHTLLDRTSAPEKIATHDHLLEIFDAMVEMQLRFEEEKSGNAALRAPQSG